MTIQHALTTPDAKLNSFILVTRIYMDGIASKFNLNPTALLVLIGLANHFNPQKNIVFPSQEYLANNLNISERSVVRAIKILLEKKLIIKSKKGLNNIYCFTSVFFEALKLSPTKCQNGTYKGDNLADKHNNNKFRNNIINFQKNEINGVNYPSSEETKELINKQKQIKRGSPLDYDFEQAKEFLDKLIPELQNSFFAKELRKKWNIPPKN